MRRAVVLTVLWLMALPSAWALQLGDLALESQPGAPLSGRIPIIDAGGMSLDRVQADLAGDRAHAEAGINPSALPPGLMLTRGGAATDDIQVTTANPPELAADGPALEFLVRLRWSEGQVLRRYRVESDGVALQGTASSTARYGPTEGDDTLYSIAERLRPQAVTNNQMMLSLLAENPASFNADNVNALQRDAFLTVPRGDALRFPDEATATERVLAQQRTWRTGERPQAVEGSAPEAPEAPEPSEPPQSPEPVSDIRPMLALLPADPAATQPTAAERDARVNEALAPLEAQLDRLETSNESLSAQNRSLQETLSQLQSDVQRLEGLLAQSVPASRPTASAAPTAATAVEQRADAVTAAMVRAWLMDEARAAIANPRATLRAPWAQWTLGGVALLLMLVLFRIRRRRRVRQGAAAAAMPPHWQPSRSDVAAGPVAAEPSLGETRVRPLDEAPGDPLERAGELIAYGQLDGAQSVLDEALGEEPDSVDLRLKLLDVLAMREDQAGFESEAHVLQAQINDPEDVRWQRIAAKGRMLSPDYPLFQA